MVLPSGLKLTLVTLLPCSSKDLITLPSGCQTLTVLSSLAEAISSPSGLKLTLFTLFLCPVKVETRVPSPRQSFTVLSSLAEAIIPLLGLILKLFIQFLCPGKVFNSRGCLPDCLGSCQSFTTSSLP